MHGDESPAFLASNSGYDVWLGNSRGNKFSNRHVKYTLDDNRFWRFSWQEMGQYDMKAVTEYVLNYTSQKNMVYIGHS